MREITDSFIEDLKNGILSPLLQQVKKDEDLGLEIRNNNKIRIYYQGDVMFEIIQRKSGGYKVDWCEECLAVDPFGETNCNLYENIVQTKSEIVPWIQDIPQLKRALDEYSVIYGKGGQKKYERQKAINDYNSFESKELKQFVICDQVYENRKQRSPVFHIVALYFPPSKNKNLANSGWRLAFIEIVPPYAVSHDLPITINRFEKLTQFISNTEKLDVVKNEIVQIFKQKQKIGLIDPQYEVSESSMQKPMLLYLPSGIILYPNGLDDIFNSLVRVGFVNKSVVEIFTAKDLRPYDKDKLERLFQEQEMLKLIQS